MSRDIRIGRAELVCATPGVQPAVRPLALPISIIGRRKTAEVFVDDRAVSLSHAAIAYDGKEFWVRDLLSRNGTFVDDRMVGEQRLREHSVLRVGDLTYGFIVADPHLLRHTMIHRPAEVAISYDQFGGQQRLERVVTTIGSNSHCDVVFTTAGVTAVHAILVRTSSGLWIHDMATVSGTFLNGLRVDQTLVRSGDSIRIGDSTITCSVLRAGSSQEPRYTSGLLAHSANEPIESSAAGYPLSDPGFDADWSSGERRGVEPA